MKDAGFSGDEFLAFAVFAVVGIVGTVQYYRRVLMIPALGRSSLRRVALSIHPLALIGIDCAVICIWADPQVSRHLDYIALFLLAGLAWMFMPIQAMPVMGIDFGGDAIDRNNPAAFWTVCGVMTGFSTVFAFSNVGDGPTIWTTIGPAAMASAVLLFFWIVGEWISGGLFEAITIDRDEASALRLAGTLVGSAILLGRAAGGTWVSMSRTIVDLLEFGSPGLLFAAAMGMLQRFLKPTADKPVPKVVMAGVVPGSCFILLGVAVVALLPHGWNVSKW